MSQVQPEVNGPEVKVVFREANIPNPVEKIDRSGRVDWGDDNLYPQFLWYLVENSPIHQGIICNKVDYIVSGGLAYEGDQAEFEKILANGLSDYNLNEVAEMACLDNEVAYCYYLHAKKDPVTKWWQIDPMEFEYIRPNEDNSIFYYSEDWSTKRQTAKTRYREIPSFFNRKTSDKECLLQVKTSSRQSKSPYQRKVSGGFFSQPGYSGGIPSILTDIEINYFGYAEVVNGFKGGTFIYMPNGDPKDETTRRTVLKNLKAEGTDRNKQAGITVAFGEGEAEKPTIEQMNGNDLDKRYEGTDIRLIKKIMIAHGVTNPKLFGVMSEATLSESDDEAAYNRFQKNYANKRRKSLADSLNFLHKKLNGITGTLSFNTPSLYDNDESEEQEIIDKLNQAPVALQTTVINTDMTSNERRRLVGMNPIEGGDVRTGSPANIAMRTMQTQDPVLVAFENCGRPKEAFRFVTSRKAQFDVDDDAAFIAETFKHRFAALTDVHLNVLRLIGDGKSDKAIQDELHLDTKDLAAARSALTKGGYIDGGELTTKGQIEVVNIEEVEVVYSYEERPDAPPLQTVSRPFCIEMMKLNRVYTRAEINTISQAVGRNVWLYRGGWYHDPQTDKNQPSCRHYWNQAITIKR